MDNYSSPLSKLIKQKLGLVGTLQGLLRLSDSNKNMLHVVARLPGGLMSSSIFMLKEKMTRRKLIIHK